MYLRPPGIMAKHHGLDLLYLPTPIITHLFQREQMTLKTAMAAPYPRILVMHATVLLGGLLVEAMHSPVAMLILLVALKTYVDFRLHRKERHRSARPLPMTPAEGAASP